MKKINKGFLFLIILISSIALCSFSANADESPKPSHIVLHYFRYEEDYQDYTVWLWKKNAEGIEHDFLTNSEILKDEFGCYKEIPLTGSYEGAEEMGIIIKKGPGWNGSKDVEGDRYFTLDAKNTDASNKAHVYFVEKTPEVGYTSTDLDKSDKILTSYFKTIKQIIVSLSSPATSYQVYKNDEKIVDSTSGSKSLTISLDQNADLNCIYKIVANFGEIKKESAITFDGIYDTKEFEQAYSYDGYLGAFYTKNETVFTVWAPTQLKIEVAIYNTGSPKLDYRGNAISGGTDTPTSTHAMIKKEKGVFEYKFQGNLLNQYYTYRVYDNASSTIYKEIADPYAKSTGINGIRGMIVDFAQVNPENWEYNKRPNSERTLNNAIVYELHVRDLTTHSSWNGTESNRGKFAGLTEEKTTYTKDGKTVKTGFDHIKELGVTDVQLLPIFDYGVVDETRLKDPAYQNAKPGVFNWGYMPENYNALEGSYSSNPYDGISKIKEFKQVVQKFNQNDIGIIMDVVYNHTGKTADSNFNILVPGYYHRKTGDTFSNGSGCGNETASERLMMRKFMVDSILFWAKEYNLSGFRFDLMALHDYETMNLIAAELQKIDPSIIVYGEPWNGGSTPLPVSKDAGKTNIKNMPLVGAFNDEIRDAIKGSVFSVKEGGFVQGKTSNKTMEQLKYGIAGGVNHPQINFTTMGNTAWHTSPKNTVNYVSAHDNNTLWDKLILSKSATTDERILMQNQSNAMVLTAQGLSFLHAGVEIARSKPLSGGGYDHNSYESPDSVNQIDWRRKVDYYQVFEYHQQLIDLKKSHKSFNLTTADEVKSKLSFIDTGDLNTVAYTIKNDEDTFKEVMVIHNGKDFSSIQLAGKWQIIGDDRGIFKESMGEIIDGNLALLNNTTYILYKGDKINTGNENPTPEDGKGCGKKAGIASSEVLLTILGSISLMGVGTYLFSRKK